MAYATQAYLLGCYDSRLIAEMTSDSGFPSSLDIPNPVITQLLGEASDMITAAVEVGGRYDSSLLIPLSQSSTTGFLLRRLTCDLAFGLIMKRRGRSVQDISRIAPAYTEALDILAKIGEGSWIFPGINDVFYEEAGLPTGVPLDTPSPGIQPAILLTDIANRLFPYSQGRSTYGYNW